MTSHKERKKCREPVTCEGRRDCKSAGENETQTHCHADLWDDNDDDFGARVHHVRGSRQARAVRSAATNDDDTLKRLVKFVAPMYNKQHSDTGESRSPWATLAASTQRFELDVKRAHHDPRCR